MWLLVVLGCATPLSWEADVGPLVQSRCLGCHTEAGASGDLVLEPDAYDAMVGVPSTQSPDMLLIEPGDVLYSYVWHKLNGSQGIAGGAGGSMPIGQPLEDFEVELIEAWIDAGAPR